LLAEWDSLDLTQADPIKLGNFFLAWAYMYRLHCGDRHHRNIKIQLNESRLVHFDFDFILLGGNSCWIYVLMEWETQIN
jgi:hypothetical protein